LIAKGERLVGWSYFAGYAGGVLAGVEVSVGVVHKTLADAQLAAAEGNPR
jgi:hypothetical protein